MKVPSASVCVSPLEDPLPLPSKSRLSHTDANVGISEGGTVVENDASLESAYAGATLTSTFWMCTPGRDRKDHLTKQVGMVRYLPYFYREDLIFGVNVKIAFPYPSQRVILIELDPGQCR